MAGSSAGFSDIEARLLKTTLRARQLEYRRRVDGKISTAYKANVMAALLGSLLIVLSLEVAWEPGSLALDVVMGLITPVSLANLWLVVWRYALTWPSSEWCWMLLPVLCDASCVPSFCRYYLCKQYSKNIDPTGQAKHEK